MMGPLAAIGAVLSVNDPATGVPPNLIQLRYGFEEEVEVRVEEEVETLRFWHRPTGRTT